MNRKKLPKLSPEVLAELRAKFVDWEPPKPPPVAQDYHCSDCGTHVKLKKCKCGKAPTVYATGGLFPQYYVRCECGEQSWDSRAYPDKAIRSWNKEGHAPRRDT